MIALADEDPSTQNIRLRYFFSFLIIQMGSKYEIFLVALHKLAIDVAYMSGFKKLLKIESQHYWF